MGKIVDKATVMEEYFDMVYILNDTDIFDEVIDDKFKKLIDSDIDSFLSGKAYSFTVSFHVNLIDDVRFQYFDIPPSKTSKRIKADKVRDVMSHQLERLEQVLIENNIEVYLTAIQGDNLESEKMVKIELYEDETKPFFNGRGKDKKRMRISTIMPSLPYTQAIVTKYAAERIGKIFNSFMNIIKSKKLMSEILGIPETDDDNILIRAFFDQYGELWHTSKEREQELWNHFVERSKTAAERYLNKQDKCE